ncbi:hypothetical protein [Anaerococcus jeddahensis]|uniref:hypothetical protein n=1 Tax=Anaerococcus jeddahensis TaxID=1673719 RepID=UPI0006725DBE|nr:hypothetical protein [Anaerococcus jeddahensis]
MKIKKVLPVLALTVALVGCGKKADTKSNAESTPASTTTTEKSDSNASTTDSNASATDSNAESTPASDAGSNK